MGRNINGPNWESRIVNNKYFDYWKINHPVFLSGEKPLFNAGPSQKLKERLMTQLSVGMHLQIIEGEPGTGKTTVLKKIAADLSIDLWDVLYLSSSEELLYLSFVRRLMNFLNTSDTHQAFPSLQKIISNLERISRSRRKILILLDVDSTAKNIESFARDARPLFEIIQSHNLALYCIISIPTEFSDSIRTLKDKAAWSGALKSFNKKEMQQVIQMYLEQAHLSPNLFDESIISYIYKLANGSLARSLQLGESLLIDASISESLTIKLPDSEPDQNEAESLAPSNLHLISQTIPSSTLPSALQLNQNSLTSLDLQIFPPATLGHEERTYPPIVKNPPSLNTDEMPKTDHLSTIHIVDLEIKSNSVQNAEKNTEQNPEQNTERDAGRNTEQNLGSQMVAAVSETISEISSPKLELDLISTDENHALLAGTESVTTKQPEFVALEISIEEMPLIKNESELVADKDTTDKVTANSVKVNESIPDVRKTDAKKQLKKGNKSRIKPKSQELKPRQSLSSLTKPQ